MDIMPQAIRDTMPSRSRSTSVPPPLPSSHSRSVVIDLKHLIVIGSILGGIFVLGFLAIFTSFSKNSTPESSARESFTLTPAEASRRAAVSRYENAQSQAAALHRELISTENEKARYQTGMQDYLMDHKMATAAIVAGLGGTGVAIDPRNHFSADAKKIGGAVAVLAAVWAAVNHEEVIEVADRLTKASTMMDTFDARAKHLRVQISEVEAEAANAQSLL